MQKGLTVIQMEPVWVFFNLFFINVSINKYILMNYWLNMNYNKV